MYIENKGMGFRNQTQHQCIQYKSPIKIVNRGPTMSEANSGERRVYITAHLFYIKKYFRRPQAVRVGMDFPQGWPK